MSKAITVSSGDTVCVAPDGKIAVSKKKSSSYAIGITAYERIKKKCKYLTVEEFLNDLDSNCLIRNFEFSQEAMEDLFRRLLENEILLKFIQKNSIIIYLMSNDVSVKILKYVLDILNGVADSDEQFKSHIPNQRQGNSM